MPSANRRVRHATSAGTRHARRARDGRGRHRREVAQRRGDGAIADLARRRRSVTKMPFSTAASTLATSDCRAAHRAPPRRHRCRERASPHRAHRSRMTSNSRPGPRGECCRSPSSSPRAAQRARGRATARAQIHAFASARPRRRSSRRARRAVGELRRATVNPRRGTRAASSGSSICAEQASPRCPTSTSPLPPVASAGVPAAHTSLRPSGAVRTVGTPLSSTTPQVAGARAPTSNGNRKPFDRPSRSNARTRACGVTMPHACQAAANAGMSPSNTLSASASRSAGPVTLAEIRSTNARRLRSVTESGPMTTASAQSQVGVLDFRRPHRRPRVKR